MIEQLLASAQQQFESRATLAQPGDDTGDNSADAMVRRLAKKGNVKAKRAARRVKCPPEFAYLIEWYDLIRGHTALGMRFEPLQFSDIESFGRLWQKEVDAFDAEMLHHIDIKWRASIPSSKPATTPPGPEASLN